jgi:hypothetical protein
MQLISTMGQPLLVFGAKAVFECIDPATDLNVTGVTVTDPVVAGVNLSDDGSAAPPVPVGPFMLVPGPGA